MYLHVCLGSTAVLLYTWYTVVLVPALLLDTVATTATAVATHVLGTVPRAVHNTHEDWS